jgi:hypothetical protein
MRSMLALALVVSASLPTASAQKATEVFGVVDSVDAEAGVVSVITPASKEPRKLNLLKRDLPVTHASGDALTLESLRPGQRIMLRLDQDEEYVVAIRVDADCLWGSLAQIDTDKKTLVVRCGGYNTQTIVVTPDVRLLRDGEPVQLQDLKAAQSVTLVFAPDHRRLLQIQSGRGHSGTSPYGRPAPGGGLLVAVDHARKRLQLITLTERYQHQELEYDEWTDMNLVYSSYHLRDADIHDLRAPCRVSFYYDRDTRRLCSLQVDVPRLVRRTVAKFDRERRKLTLLLDDDQTEEFDVAADAKIMRGYQPTGSLEDVKEGNPVQAGLSLDNKVVIFLQLLDK